MKGFKPDIQVLNNTTVKVSIIVARWNSFITEKLLNSAKSTLIENGLSANHIQIMYVPGCFELPFAAKYSLAQADAAIVIGCLIQGDTPHFEYIAQACAHGTMQVSLETLKPCVFAVLTVLNETQALERTDENRVGDKGKEAALSLIQLLNLK